MEHINEINLKDFFENPIGLIERFRWKNEVTPFSTILFPIVCSFGYLAVIYGLQSFMKNKKEIKLHGFALFHNLFLCLLSLFMFLGIVVPIAKSSFPQGLYHSLCKPIDSGLVNFSYYIFYLSKVYEFIDTIIQVLRKKNLIFLHVYHHFITLWLVWVNLTMDTGVQWVDISANCFVHIIMYFYYFQTERGINPWWKKYITVVQIIQFVVDMGTHILWHYFDVQGNYNPNYCSGTLTASFFSDFVILSFLGLFIQFFVKSYNNKRSAIKKKAN
ncbi:hypothetical protein RB653_003723 [Dictyostelium firmibasis]|uniref:Elongation of fatty acids protein n=1 Tax=Dictyostelium firmibasis TaxID=79012 RepID=A0AAN7Z2R5_9MYCE